MDVKKKLLADIRRADYDFGLINKGDKIMVGVSGGKDSMALLYLLSIYQKFADKDFSFVGVMLDLGFPKNDISPIEEFCKENNIEFKTSDASDVYPILLQHKNGDQLPCSICSRMKKASINKVAKEMGFKKVSFAHHMDDAIETLIMNMTHGGRLATFSPKMFLEKSQIEFIRPLIYCREKDITSFIKQYNIPVIKSTCTNDKTSQRATFKNILLNHYKEFYDAHNNFAKMMINKDHADLWFNMIGYNDGEGYFYQAANDSKAYQKVVYIRNKVFIQEQNVPPSEEFDESEFDSISYLVTYLNKPVATVRVKKIGEKTYNIGRFAVMKEYREKGIGKKLLHYVEKVLSQKETPITFILNAQTHALEFYKKCGYMEVGEPFLEANIMHIKMEKTLKNAIMDKAKDN